MPERSDSQLRKKAIRSDKDPLLDEVMPETRLTRRQELLIEARVDQYVKIADVLRQIYELSVGTGNTSALDAVAARIVPITRELPGIKIIDDIDLNIVSNPNFYSISWDSFFNFWKRPYGGLYIPVTYNIWAILKLINQYFFLEKHISFSSSCTRKEGALS